MPFIKSFCVFNATLAIYRYYAHCQVMKERGHMSLITFSFIFKYNSPVSFTNLLVFCHTEKNQLWSYYSKACLSCPLSFSTSQIKKKKASLVLMNFV